MLTQRHGKYIILTNEMQPIKHYDHQDFSSLQYGGTPRLGSQSLHATCFRYGLHAKHCRYWL